MRALLHSELIQPRRSFVFLRWEQVMVVLLAALLIFPSLYAMSTMPTAPAFFDGPIQTMFWAQLAVWVVHTATIFRCISFGVYAMSREYEGQTWEPLIMTGVSIPQIIIGKWRATLRRSCGYLIALGLVRLLILPITMVANVVPLSSDALRYAYC